MTVRAAISIPPARATKGVEVLRAAAAIAYARREQVSPTELAKARWGDGVVEVIRAAVAGSTYGDTGSAERAVGEFVARVVEASVLGRLNARRVPPRTRFLTPATGITATWTRPGAAMAVQRPAFSGYSLTPLEIGAICVASRESLDAVVGGDPLAEAAMLSELVNAVAAGIDQSMLDDTNAGTTDVEPASLTSAITPNLAGSDPLADLKGLVTDFAGDLETSILVMRPGIAASLAGRDFPDINLRSGGSLWGIPIALTRHAPADSIALIDAGGVATCDGGVRLDVSDEAAIEMSDGPSGDGNSPATGASVVSLWQVNSVGLKIRTAVNWKAIRTGAVAWLDSVSYRPFTT